MTIECAAISAAPVGDRSTVYCAAYDVPADVRSTSTVITSPVPCTSILRICASAPTTPSSASGPDGAVSSSATADSRSPRPTAVRYTRTTLAASRANGDVAPCTSDAAVGVGEAIGGGVAVGGGVGLRSAFASGVGVAGTGGALASGTGDAVASAEPCGDGDDAGRGDTTATDAECDGAGDGRRDAPGEGDGDGDGSSDGDDSGVGVCATSGVGDAGAPSAGGIVAARVGAASGDACLPASDSPAPMTKPSTITPINTGTRENAGPLFCGERRDRLGGVPCIGHSFSSSPQRRLASRARNGRRCGDAKAARVIRVSIPIDVGTVAATASSAFAHATPIRVDRLLALAVGQACGARAPQDKRDRSIRAALDGFRAGKFMIDIDGRLFDRPEAIVVCSGSATLRFFFAEPARRATEPLG